MGAPSRRKKQPPAAASTARTAQRPATNVVELRLSTAGSSAELAKRLKRTWERLQRTPNRHAIEEETKQDDDASSAPLSLDILQMVRSELICENVMESDDANVRSLTACCFVDLLRIQAPDMPFASNEELYDVFQLILEQLRCLANDREGAIANAAIEMQSFYVLESLATVKSGLLLIGVEFTNEEDEATLLVQLFSTLFNTLNSGHSVKMESLMLSIMATCIEESDAVDQQLLDVILGPLVQPPAPVASVGANTQGNDAKIERGPYHMAQELIRRTADQLQRPLAHFFNSVLVDASSIGGQKPSDLNEHVYSLIYEVHKIRASLLLYVLPNVCLQLQVDDVATRSEAIALMGRLFASSHADYGHEFMKNFREFLGRFRDLSKDIRLQMIQVSAIIWNRKPALGSAIEKEFIQRLNDPDWEVRRLVVNEVCDLAVNQLELVSEECLRAVGERMKDKKVVLRKETMTGLSQVYATHVSAYWKSDSSDEEDQLLIAVSASNVPTSHMKKLAWVPDYVFKCFAYPQQELKLRVVQLLDDILLPKGFSEPLRAKGLLFIFQTLDSVSKEALTRIWSERIKCIDKCQTFLTSRRLIRLQCESNIGAMDAARDALYEGLQPLFNETENLSSLLDQFSKSKDQSIFKHLGLLCDFSKSQDDIRSGRDRLVKSVGSKTSLGELLKNLCRKMNLLTLNQETIGSLIGSLVHQDGAHVVKINRSVIDLLLIVSKVMPALFTPFISEEFEMILVENDHQSVKKRNGNETSDEEYEEDDSKDEKVVVGMLAVLANYSRYWRKKQESTNDVLAIEDEEGIPSSLLRKYLQDTYCLGPTDIQQWEAPSTVYGHVSKLAALALSNFFGTEKETSSLIQQLCVKKRLHSQHPPAVLATLYSLEIFSKRCGTSFSQNHSLLLNLWTTLIEDFIIQIGSWSSNAPSKTGRKSKAANVASTLLEIRCVAIEVAINLQLYCDGGDQSSFVLASKSQELMKALFELLRSDGRVWTSNATLAIQLRRVASCGLLKMMRSSRLESSLSVSEWHVLGFVMQDSSEEVRKAFVKKMTSHLIKRSVPHPHKYLSYLALAATESSAPLKKMVRHLLVVAVERMRRMFEASSSRSASQESDSTAGHRRQNVNALMVPEYSLPYVIHLLVHHPDFPKDVAETSVITKVSLFSFSRWSEQLSYLNFFIDGLVSSNSAEADNIAFLLQILTKLSDCHDATSPNAMHIYPLIDSAVILLKKKIKSLSNLKSFPGKIYLPKQLYGPGTSIVDTIDLLDKPMDDSPQEQPLGAFQRSKPPRIMVSFTVLLRVDRRANTNPYDVDL